MSFFVPAKTTFIIDKDPTKISNNIKRCAPWCSGYHYSTTSFNKIRSQV